MRTILGIPLFSFPLKIGVDFEEWSISSVVTYFEAIQGHHTWASNMGSQVFFFNI